MKVVYNAYYGGYTISSKALTRLAELKGVPTDDQEFIDEWERGDCRHDLDLIKVIEELGEKANGYLAKLVLEEIPDGASYEICEYDGKESVEPPRMSWEDFTV